MKAGFLVFRKSHADRADFDGVAGRQRSVSMYLLASRGVFPLCECRVRERSKWNGSKR